MLRLTNAPRNGISNLKNSVLRRRNAVRRRIGRWRSLGNGERKIAEVDLLLRNGDGDVAVEVKTTCRPEHIGEHVRRLGKLHEWIPECAEGRKKLYGAVAALKYTAEADTYAQKKGMYVLKGKGGIFAISNERDFRPVSY